jgi:hypothetical protein
LAKIGILSWQQCLGEVNADNARDISELKMDILLQVVQFNDGDISFYHGMGDGWLVELIVPGTCYGKKLMEVQIRRLFRRILPSTDGNYYLIGTSWSTDGDITYNPYPGTGSFG